MSRYKDVEPLEKALEAKRSEIEGSVFSEGFEAALSVVSGILRLVPTADVVEVRHGKWKKASDKYPRYVCTSCNHLYNNKNYKYCPNCGAKMDGERREE